MMAWICPLVPLGPARGTFYRNRAWDIGETKAGYEIGVPEPYELPAQYAARSAYTPYGREIIHDLVSPSRMSSRTWRYYIPTRDDLEAVHLSFPDIEEPADVPWLMVEAALIVAGYERGELVKLKAPALLGLLRKAHQPDAGTRTPVEVSTAEVKIPNRARKAGEQYRRALEIVGDSATDRAVYDNVAPALRNSGETADLPSFETWQRNLREYRRLTGRQKNTPRTQRPRLRASCASPDQLAGSELPTSIRSKSADE